MATANVSDWTPDPADVKVFIPRRLDAGPFTAASKPSADDVVTLVDNVVAIVLGDVGPLPDDENVLRVARSAVALGAAYYVEQGFFPEQQDRDGTADRLYERFQEQLARLRSMVADYGQDPRRVTIGTLTMASGVVAAAPQSVLDEASADAAADALRRRNRSGTGW